MKLSDIGILADVFWYEIKNHAKNILLDAFIVMPNHIHGILILDGNFVGDEFRDKAVECGRDKACLVPTDDTNKSTNIKLKIIGQIRFQNQGKNTVSSIIGSYKSAVSKHAHRMGYEFKWQSRFYDHKIRDDESLKRIQNYIILNPQKWNNDKFYE